jgi:hypothetical protein
MLSLIQYICYTPSNPKWLRCAWNSNLISNYAHIYMEFIICIVVSLTTLDPISLGTKMYLNIVLGTLEMQWMLVSFIRKVLSPYDNWTQARMIGELLSTTSHHIIAISVTSIIFMRTFLASQSCRLALGMIIFICKCCGSCKGLIKKSHYFICEQVEMIAYDGKYIKSCLWFTNPKYAFLAIYCILIPQCSLMCSIDNVASCTILYYACCLSKHLNYLLVPYC